MSLQALTDWLKADPKRARDVMWQNKSYVFFRELQGAEAAAPLGVLDVPLTTGRSLAVDAGVHALGLPIFVSAPTLTHAGGTGGFHRLMVAQDVGSAIRGPERGDLYLRLGRCSRQACRRDQAPRHFSRPVARHAGDGRLEAYADRTCDQGDGQHSRGTCEAPRAP